MRIAQINLPLFNNDSLPIAPAHKALASDLVGQFGGFTAWDAQGAWAHNGELYHEPVKVYQVAYSGSNGDDEIIRAFALKAGIAGGQISVFAVIDGKPELLETPKPAQVEVA
jgi:hypothetical protein